jgi:hypothetical protein
MRLRSLCVAALLVFGSSTAFAQPAPATLISPSADVVGSTITFTWQSSAGATWYHFWLGKPDTTLVTEQWYTAEHAGCAMGGTCAIALAPPISAGAFVWHIRTWSSAGYGPWSLGYMFTARDVVPAWSSLLPSSRRFSVVMNETAVLDNETGLVWQRVVSAPVSGWHNAGLSCILTTTGNRRGWRLPTLSELQTLTEPARSNPALPVGHPFESATGVVWSVTPHEGLAGYYYGVSFDSGGASSASSSSIDRRVLCVRGASSH